MRFLEVAGIIIFVSVVLLVAIIAGDAAVSKFKKRGEEKQDEGSTPKHYHDCLVEECDFHTDSEVDAMMRTWLRENKLRNVVVIDHDIKEFTLNLCIAEVSARRPLNGQITWGDD